MKLNVRMTISIPDENGYDGTLSASEIIAKSLKQNQVFEIHELLVEQDDA